MKKTQDGSIVSLLLVIIALSVVIGGVYIYSEKTRVSSSIVVSNGEGVNTNPLANNSGENPETHIDAITPSSAMMGSTLTIIGRGFNGFEGDVYFYFERSDGKVVRLLGTIISSANGNANEIQVARVVLKQPCEKGQTVYRDYSGLPGVCDYVELNAGQYKVYTMRWSKKSNAVNFTIMASPSASNSSWSAYSNPELGFGLNIPVGTKIMNQNQIVFFTPPASAFSDLNISPFIEVSVAGKVYKNGILISAPKCDDGNINSSSSDIEINLVEFSKTDISSQYGGMMSASVAASYCVLHNGIRYRIVPRISYNRYSETLSQSEHASYLKKFDDVMKKLAFRLIDQPIGVPESSMPR